MSVTAAELRALQAIADGDRWGGERPEINSEIRLLLWSRGMILPIVDGYALTDYGRASLVCVACDGAGVFVFAELDSAHVTTVGCAVCS